MSSSKKVKSSRVGKARPEPVEGLKGPALSLSKGSKVAEGKSAKGKKQKRNVIKTRPQPDNLTILQPATNITKNILRILAIVIVIGITIYIYSIRDRVDEFAEYGYPGIFLVTLLANATIILPAPGVAVVFAMGAVFNPLGVAFAAGAGGALGELTGYLAGFSGQAVVENTNVYDRILPWLKKYGAWVILVLSAFPNPFFDLAGIAAGIAKIPLWQFLLACWVGQTLKMAMFAFAGAYSIDWLAKLF